MIEHAFVSEWLQRYVSAWKSYDAAEIGALFSQDARYFYTPFDEPLLGRDAIVTSWLEHPDPQGTYDAFYKPIMVEDNVAIVNGRTRYFYAGGDALRTEFDNVFVLHFNDNHECIEFREWYMERP
jgi:SnoaL-like domain